MSYVKLIDKYWSKDLTDLYKWMYSYPVDTISFNHREDEKIIFANGEEIYKLVKIELKKEFLKTILEGDMLKVSYQLPKDIELDDFQCGSFEKKYKMSKGTKKEDIKVKYNGGILTIIVKKNPQPAVESYEIPLE